MRYKFFHIPAEMSTAAEESLNRFVASHSITHIEKHFSDRDGRGFWSFCVCYLEGQTNSGQPKPKIDYKEVLTEEDFEIFSQLRTLRKERAEKEGTPVYAVATNEQLAEIARRRIVTKAGLVKIPGFGTAKIERHGDAIDRKSVV